MIRRPSIGLPLILALGLSAGISAAQPATAHAEDGSVLDAAMDDTPRSYWFASFQGGLMTPISSMEETHDRGLVANARLGFTSRYNIGLAVSGNYSPLPRAVPGNAAPGTAIETHFGVVSAAPRITLGRQTLRVWVAAGGGVVMERNTVRVASVKTDSTTEIEPAATGDAGIELHLFANGGFAVNGNYTHSFGDVASRLYSVLGGLVFTFK